MDRVCLVNWLLVPSRTRSPARQGKQERKKGIVNVDGGVGASVQNTVGNQYTISGETMKIWAAIIWIPSTIIDAK